MRHEANIDYRTYKDIVNVAIASGSNADADLFHFCQDTNPAIRKDSEAEVTLNIKDSFGVTSYGSVNLVK